MTEPDLVRALRPVTDALEALGVRYYVGGSLASSAHGIARSSLDVDVLTELKPGHLAGFAGRLADRYYVPEDAARRAVVDHRSFNVIHLETMVKVDVFVSGGRAFDDRCLERATPRTPPGATGPVRFASAEDTVLLKLEWYRRGGCLSERQWSDVQGMLRTLGPAVADRVYLERWADAIGVRDLLDRALSEAGWMPSAERPVQ